MAKLIVEYEIDGVDSKLQDPLELAQDMVDTAFMWDAHGASVTVSEVRWSE